MNRLTGAVADLTTRRPVVVLLVLVLVTLGAGAAASQQEQVEDGAEGADGRAAEAGDLVSEVFDSSGAPFQVLVRSPGRDVRNAEALETTAAIQAAITEGDVADRLDAPGDSPPVLGFLSPALEGAREADRTLDELDDDAVRALQDQALERLPDQVSEQVGELVASGEEPDAGLILVFLDVADLDDDTRLAVEREVAGVVESVPVPDGISVDVFTPQLLTDQGDIGPEIGRLFSIALGLILVLLCVVFWVQPAEGQRGSVARRVGADVGLTLVVILAAVIWMQGFGVLLGPDYAGLIGYFSPQTQVVPIIIVGLGVDYAIHFHSRYRDGLAAGEGPEGSVRRTATTVGVALLLATVTTAIGFLTNLTSPFESLATLGVLAAVGITSAWVLTVAAIPAARVLLDRRGARRGGLPVESLENRSEGRLHRLAGSAAVLAERAPVPTLVIAALLAAAGGWGFTQLDREFSFTDFVPRDAPMLETFEAIEDRFGGGFGERTDVLVVGDVGTVEAHNALVESLEAAADVDGVQLVDGRPDATSPISVLGQVLDDDPDLVEGLDLDESLRIDGDDETVTALYDELLSFAPEEAGEVLAEVEGAMWARVSVRTAVDEGDAVRLADDMEAAFAPMASAGPDVVATSQDIVSGGLTEQIERAQLLSIALAVGVVALLLTAYYWFAHRRPLLGPVTSIPVVLVLAWTFGTMALLGIPLTPVTATLAALSIGVGIDFSIHVTNRFEEEVERDPGAGHVHLLRTTTGETGSALLGSALTTVIGFGVLITSTLVPFQQLGLVTVLAIGYSLLAALLVLPSLLRLADRRSETEQRRARPERP